MSYGAHYFGEGDVYGPEYRPEELGIPFGPEYRPDLMPSPLPSWLIPLAVGTGAFVLLGGLTLLGLKRTRRKRRS